MFIQYIHNGGNKKDANWPFTGGGPLKKCLTQGSKAAGGGGVKKFCYFWLFTFG